MRYMGNINLLILNKKYLPFSIFLNILMVNTRLGLHARLKKAFMWRNVLPLARTKRYLKRNNNNNKLICIVNRWYNSAMKLWKNLGRRGQQGPNRTTKRDTLEANAFTSQRMQRLRPVKPFLYFIPFGVH